MRYPLVDGLVGMPANLVRSKPTKYLFALELAAVIANLQVTLHTIQSGGASQIRCHPNIAVSRYHSHNYQYSSIISNL